ncbi:MAG: FGGY-family carbohydrate kinase [Thermomicrobiales bacterium]|nr:FGGY-family carbohydrate kinase [Thermomicrobiales bacterium]
MAGSLLLGVDIGTSSAKGVLCTAGGAILATAEAPHGFSSPKPGWAEQDADAVWWAGFVAVCRQLLSGKWTGDDVGAIGVSAIGPTVLPVDANGRPLRPGILYGIDTRATGQIAALERDPGFEAIFALNGQIPTTQSAGPKIRWIRENEPDVFAKTDRILTAASYLVHRLTGEYVMSRHEASYFTPLVDLERLEFDDRFADRIAPVSLLPRLAWSSEIAGVVTPAAAEETGLRVGTPVSAGAIDAAAEALSVGVTAPGDLMMMYGSTLFFILTTDGPRPDPLVWATGYLTPGSYSIGAGMSTSGLLTRWFRDELAGAEVTAEAIGGVNAYAALAEQASAVPPGADGLLVLPYFSGERTPINDPDARGVIAGLTLQHTRGHIYRALIEATAYGAWHILDAFDVIGADVRRIVAVGGGTNNELWLRIMSDVTGRTQMIPEVTIGASYGDAFLAGLATGLVPSIETLVRDWVRPARVIEPDPRHRDIYDRYYAEYRALYPAVKDSLHRLAGLGR